MLNIIIMCTYIYIIHADICVAIILYVHMYVYRKDKISIKYHACTQ